MKVNWYSNHVIPILDVEEMGGIVVAMDNKIYTTEGYNKEDNTCYSEKFGGAICLSDARVKGWCYTKYLYPSETVI